MMPRLTTNVFSEESEFQVRFDLLLEHVPILGRWYKDDIMTFIKDRKYSLKMHLPVVNEIKLRSRFLAIFEPINIMNPFLND